MIVNDDYIIWLVVTGTMDWIMTFHETVGDVRKSQLTFTPSFFKMVKTTNQKITDIYIKFIFFQTPTVPSDDQTWQWDNILQTFG
jgi:hypothetical protein